MDIGTFLLMLALAYGLGVLWYDLLPGRLPAQVWRVAAYPFVGIYIAESLIPRLLTADPTFGGVHVVTALIGSIVAVIVDWIITAARHPSEVTAAERGFQPQAVWCGRVFCTPHPSNHLMQFQHPSNLFLATGRYHSGN